MMPLGMELSLGTGHVVLDVEPAPPKRGTTPYFQATNVLVVNLKCGLRTTVNFTIKVVQILHQNSYCTFCLKCKLFAKLYFRHG